MARGMDLVGRTFERFPNGRPDAVRDPVSGRYVA